MACAGVQFATKEALGLRQGPLFNENPRRDAGRFETNLLQVSSRLSDQCLREEGERRGVWSSGAEHNKKYIHVQ